MHYCKNCCAAVYMELSIRPTFPANKSVRMPEADTVLFKLFEEGNASAFLVCLASVRHQKKFVRSFMAPLRKETIALKQLIMLSKDFFPVPVLLAATTTN